MGIRFRPNKADDQGLPIVSWEEDRNFLSWDGRSYALISCFIRPDEAGQLQFVSAGPSRHGLFEEARPWQKLVSFTAERAEKLYQSPVDRAFVDIVASRSKSGAGRFVASDSGLVILANFGDDRRSVPMHLNCAECTLVEAAMLHDRLRYEFIDRRFELITTKCGGEYVWPDEAPYKAHEPEAPGRGRQWLALLLDALIVIVVGLICAGLYLLFTR